MSGVRAAVPALALAAALGMLGMLATGRDTVPAGRGDIPVVGPLHPIAERDLLAVIAGAVGDLKRSGGIDRMRREARARARARLENPEPVPGIFRARADSVRVFDPSVTLGADIAAPDGTVLFRKGTRVNPLDHGPMGDPLYLFDATDPRQVRLAERLHRERGGRVRTVLVAGSWLDLTRRWKRRAHFDQGGAISRRLGIGEVPALVEQQGNRLVVRVFGPDREEDSSE